MSLVVESSYITKILETINDTLNGELEKSIGFRKMTINNDLGNGTMIGTDLFPGMATMICNIEFNEPLELQLSGNAMKAMYFIFCHSGFLKHKFEKEDNFSNIENQQNVILKGCPEGHNIMVFPKDQLLKISIITIDELRISTLKGEGRTALVEYLDELFSNIPEDEFFRYLGKIRPVTTEYVSLLMENVKGGIVGRLLTESYILRILSSQIEYHDKETDDANFDAPLKRPEINKVIKLAKFIADNIHTKITIEDLTSESSLSAKKLQKGFKGLFDMSVNNYITKVRLEKARELIIADDLNISEIVYACGLNSRSYFSKLFFKRYGVLPSDYRKAVSIKVS
ncbi:AraC family transcriptional regulator [Winogradskyella maritima]|uniref:Helix-turn-helix domain-containing protein n=1 Tax=Winogradskyella maritima TaxID=1517766 RepID=A0ABV8AFL9_9FLAO|nr:AraC family transcriptional regulator [Winogradskyella maritima]